MFNYGTTACSFCFISVHQYEAYSEQQAILSTDSYSVSMILTESTMLYKE